MAAWSARRRSRPPGRAQLPQPRCTCPEFTAAGFVTVIDCVIPDGAHLNRLLEHLSSDSSSLVVLAPSTETCRERNASRQANKRFTFDGYDQLDQSMRRDFGDRGWWLDTTELTADTTAELIAVRLGLKTATSH